MNSRQVSILTVLIIVLLGFAGGWLLEYSTPQGLGLNDDSIAYIAGARSILDGQGYREAWLVSNAPVTHFPPGYPSLLAFIGYSTGIDPLRGARALNIVLFGLNIALAGWLGWRMTGAREAGLLVSTAALLSPALLEVHSRAMSEPLYIFFTLLSFLVFDAYLAREQDNKQRTSFSIILLLLLGVLLGWAYLARYAALSLLAAILAGLLILPGSWRARIHSAGLLLLGALPWILGWTLRNRVVGGSFTNRTPGWHPISLENWELGVATLAEFFVPFKGIRNWLLAVPGLFESFLLAIGFVLLAWAFHKGFLRFFQPTRAAKPNALSFTNCLYVIVYLAVLVITMTIFDPATKFQVRILSPVYISLLLLFSGLGVWLWRQKLEPWGVIFVWVAFSLLGVFAYSQAQYAPYLRVSGGVFAGEKWFDSKVFEALDNLPTDTLILSNEPGVVYLYTGRPSAVLPREEPGISDIKPQVLNGKIVLVLFRVNKAQSVTLEYYHKLGAGLYQTDLGNTWIFSSFPE